MSDSATLFLPTSRQEERTAGTPNSARILLQVIVLALFLFPTRLVPVGPLKAVGAPYILLGLLAFLAWLASRMLPQSGGARSWSPIRFVLLLFLASCLFAYAVGYHRVLTTDESHGADRTLLLFLAYLGVGLLAADGLRTQDDVLRVVRVLLFGAYFSALIGVLQYVAGFKYQSWVTPPGFQPDGFIYQGLRGGGVRAAGTAFHPIEFGVVSAAMLPLCLNRMRFSAMRSQRLWHAGGAVLLVFAAVTSISRSAILGLLVAVAIYAWSWPWRNKLNGLIAGLLVAGVMVAVSGRAINSLRYLFTNASHDHSFNSRVADYSSVERYFHNSPVVGRGLGTFLPTLYLQLDNQYLNTLIQGGLIALLVVLAVFITGALVARQTWRLAADPEIGDLGQALAAAIMVFAVSAAFFDEFAFRQATMTLFLVLGLTGAVWRLIQTRRTT
jgi:hypothetical protein